MRTWILPCGFLEGEGCRNDQALGHRYRSAEKYPVDEEGYIKLSMNALLVERGAQKVVLIDPGPLIFCLPD